MKQSYYMTPSDRKGYIPEPLPSNGVIVKEQKSPIHCDMGGFQIFQHKRSDVSRQQQRDTPALIMDENHY